MGCHLDEYERTQDPNHASAGFPTTCESCHRETDTSWRGASFDHDNVFRLQGQHATLDCASCHINDVYQGTPTDCVGCHLDEYERTQDPNHANAGFPTTCESCHRASDADWRGASFDHDEVFRLQGQHATLDCASCHINDVYQGTPRDCVGCHLDDYQQTEDPDHAAANFPTTCDSCHRASDANWFQGRFDHQFPITSGRHSGIACATCHSDGTNYAVFTCFNCHEHRRSEADDEHEDVSGYQYESLACVSCHPDGRN